MRKHKPVILELTLNRANTALVGGLCTGREFDVIRGHRGTARHKDAFYGRVESNLAFSD
jgi:hypothetical protein